MPSIVSYFIIPLVFLMLGANFYFRIKLIKQFKALSKKSINLDPKLLLNKKKRNAYFDKYYPQHKAELGSFSKNLDGLITFVVVGFGLILLSFCYLYFNQ